MQKNEPSDANAKLVGAKRRTSRTSKGVIQMDKEAILGAMETALNDNECTYKDDALSDIYDTWLRRKGNLTEILRKHPKWDEDACVPNLPLAPRRCRMTILQIWQWHLTIWD